MSEEREFEQRLRAWAASPDDSGDWGDVRRRAGETFAVPRFHRRQSVAALAAAVFLVAAVGGILLATRGVGPRPAVSGGRLTGGKGVTCYVCGPTWDSGLTGEGAYGLEPSSPKGSNPWGRAGRQIAIDELRAEAPYVPLPSSDLANDGNVGTVWVWDHTSDATVPENHVAAAVYYPTSGIELLWARGRLDYSDLESRTIDGVRAMLIPRELTELPLSILRLPVGTGEVLTLEGDVPMTHLIDVAETLSPSPGDA